jgi:cell division protein YceG involved in septum cleavage
MRLQTDPTVIYGLGNQFSGNLRRSHLKQKNRIQHLCHPWFAADAHRNAERRGD